MGSCGLFDDVSEEGDFKRNLEISHLVVGMAGLLEAL